MNEKLNDEVNKVMEDNDNKVKMELLNSEQQKLKAEIEELNFTLEIKDKSLKEIQTTNEGVIAELNELNSELKKRGEKIAKLEQQNSEFGSKKGQDNAKISELTNKISNLERERVEGEEIRHQLETELIKTRKVADSKQEVYVELADKEKEVNDLMEKHAALETEHEMIKV